MFAIGCSSPAGPSNTFEIGAWMDERGSAIVTLPADVGTATELPTTTCYIGPDPEGEWWALVASGFLGGYCNLARAVDHWDVEIHDSVPNYYFRVVVVW